MLDPLATFPTNLVLGVPNSAIESITMKDDNYVIINLKEKVFEEIERKDGNVYITIIDGQHRICGIEKAIQKLWEEITNLQKVISSGHSEELNIQLDKKSKTLDNLKNIELVVSFFIDPSLEYQAMIFSTINRTQKKVSQNLVNSLFGLDQNDTPQKTSLEITLSLNSHPNSPFYKKIMLYGGSYEKNQSPPISQATMVRSIINLICENSREAENDRHRKRRDLFKRKDGSIKFLPFRLLYAENKDFIISDILFNYFSAVRLAFINKDCLSYWDLNLNHGLNNILQTTVGYDALIKILSEILEKESPNNSQLIDRNFYATFLSKAKELNFADQRRYPFSTKGKNILYLDISIAIFPIDKLNSSDNRLKRLEEAIGE